MTSSTSNPWDVSVFLQAGQAKFFRPHGRQELVNDEHSHLGFLFVHIEHAPGERLDALIEQNQVLFFAAIRSCSGSSSR